MCGIVACRSDAPALDYLLPALEHLEYRGYDSSGVAVTAADGTLAHLRTVGRLRSLRSDVARYGGPALNGTGIGHTRWATHGDVCVRNAHPHLSCDGRVAVVHNGIIDNADDLRRELEAAGHLFRSEVDSEVVAHLVEDELRIGSSLIDSVHRATDRLRGSWAIAALGSEDTGLVITANGCPMVVGRSERGDFAASDLGAMPGWVKQAHVLSDGDFVELGPTWRWWSGDGAREAPQPIVPAYTAQDIALGTYPDYMAKEIAEQPAMAAALLDRLSNGIGDGSLWRGLGVGTPERIRVLACGSSLNAGRVIARVLRTVGSIPTESVVASEHEGRVTEAGTVILAISQSGETADVLRALDATHHAQVVALTNNLHSSLARRADAAVDCMAGPEIGVAATKTFTAQVLAGTALALSAAVVNGGLSSRSSAHLVDLLSRVPARLAFAADRAARDVPGLVASIARSRGVLFLARGAGVPYADEGALKLQELTYLWAHAYPAGELKHGPIALIEAGTPAIVLDNGTARLRANMAEIAARGAQVIDVGCTGSVLPLLGAEAVDAPWGPLEAVVGLQELARSAALVLGCDVDKPRHLAKSVTVE